MRGFQQFLANMFLMCHLLTTRLPTVKQLLHEYIHNTGNPIAGIWCGRMLAKLLLDTSIVSNYTPLYPHLQQTVIPTCYPQSGRFQLGDRPYVYFYRCPG